MLRSELCSHTFHGIFQYNHHPDLHNIRITHSSLNIPIFPIKPYQLLTLRSGTPLKQGPCKKPSLICCKNQNEEDDGDFSFSSKSQPHNHHHPDFFLASLLLPETVKHYQMRKQGFREEFSGPFVPFSSKVRDFRNDANSIGLSTLRRFSHPTIFLKISCHGDFLLPIVVGEFAVETLIDSVHDDGLGDYLNQFQFARNLVIELGYEVKMVKITNRVVNTYFAKVYFGKVGERESFSVDARPSDAINLAKRCKAPIYVNKDIVLTDAIRISYSTGRVRDAKPVYDVLLDSPLEGPDSLLKELNFVRNMKLAVEEERYADAAMWRDELIKLHNSGL